MFWRTIVATAGLILLQPGSAAEPNYGVISFENSGAPAAQADFLKGLAALHNFQYPVAARAFRSAQAADPDFALAYWGEAMSFDHPVWHEQDLAAARAALAKLGPTAEARAAKAKTPREKAYLAAVETLFGEGDVNARVWVRIREVEQSLGLIEQILRQMPAGAIRTEIVTGDDMREGVGIAEAFRGDVLAWLRLEGGVVTRCHLRDPSWFQWPLLEAAIEGNIVADFPLCNKSFNCSYSGHDL